MYKELTTTQERSVLLHQMSELIETRRTISQEILLVREQIAKLDKVIKDETEFMSAAEYITVRNNIKAELEVSMRDQIRAELLDELGQVETEHERVIPEPIVSEARYHQETKKRVGRVVSQERVSQAIVTYLKERGVPVPSAELKEAIEEQLEHEWSAKSWNQLLWRIRQEAPRIDNIMRGFYQYV